MFEQEDHSMKGDSSQHSAILGSKNEALSNLLADWLVQRKQPRTHGRVATKTPSAPSE
jgi:hypothetical protein